MVDKEEWRAPLCRRPDEHTEIQHNQDSLAKLGVECACSCHNAREFGGADVSRIAELQQENEQLRDALVTARDFIVGHPAVQGTWPLLIEVIDKALAQESGETT